MNTSLILVNSHFGLHKPAPLSPQVKHVGGMHIKEAKPLNEELEKFINDSEQGVILLSMGSMFRSESLPKNIRKAFENAFMRLPQRVIWKWENENYYNKDGKILYMKWIPQRDVLAHKNIKLFIYHGGLMGTMEAVYCGVPILGIPMYGDMPVNLAAVTSFGAGTVLAIQQITEDSVFTTINHMINNTSYKRRAEELSNIFKDRIIPPLDEAVYWTEYVIRHKGAQHLSSSSKHLYWFQYYLIDIILFLILAFFTILTLTVYPIKLLVICLKICFSQIIFKKTIKRD
ncbi:hypothetical protein O3M35_010506 [Rhynocoris fuscipes]|uniref:UDP-glucuronosyltransferase n=1 Tax=Rhynocoris fuscipes TaxID=488301 RepID=A0AAW1D672_9HEMI